MPEKPKERYRLSIEEELELIRKLNDVHQRLTEALERERQLMINKITYPASSMSRAFRYYKKGFTMCLGEMKKLFEAIQNTPKEEPKQPQENQSEPKKEEEISSGELGAFFVGID